MCHRALTTISTVAKRPRSWDCWPDLCGAERGATASTDIGPEYELTRHNIGFLTLDRIADKWTALTIQILTGGTMRYAALQREIGGISQKMLTQTLRSLERDGLVQRTVHPVVPPKVEYCLTKLGRTLIEPLQGLCRWSEKHLAELQGNRARAKQNKTE